MLITSIFSQYRYKQRCFLGPSMKIIWVNELNRCGDLITNIFSLLSQSMFH